MFSKTVFQYTHYRDFLEARLAEDAEQNGRGVRQRLANSLRCQLSYVSLVLRGDRELSSDQIAAAAKHFGLNASETEFLWLLLERERAGVPESRQLLDRLISERRKQNEELRSKVRVAQQLGDADRTVYYSDPIFAWVHMLLTIPGKWTLARMAERARIDLQRASEVLEFLVSTGLARSEGSIYLPGHSQIFLPRESPLIGQHHANWRGEAVRSARRGRAEDLHLSMVVTVSRNDLEEIRAHLGQWIAELTTRIKESPEQELAVLNIDWFTPA